jgi:oligoribonuclease NrnB/cAMP/cGMP phosphodiesterase (DHH superfamily)
MSQPNSNYSKTNLIIYHGKCPDGVAAAWCFWRFYGAEIEYHPGKFEETPPEVTNKHVLFLDFTYSVKVMLELTTKAKSITVLDHHKSALPLLEYTNLYPNLIVKLDMDRSGAQIAYDESTYTSELFNTSARPWFINDIGDRDLWQWKIPGSKDTTRAMFALGCYEVQNSFESFDKIQEKPREYYASIGEFLNKDDERIYNSLVSQAIDCIATSPIDPSQTWKVRLVSCYHSHASELGNRLVADGLCDFAVLYRYDILRNEWWLSCRASNKSSIDLVPILKQFDEKSGGHAKAAGMSLKQPLLNYFKPAAKRFAASNNLSTDLSTITQIVYVKPMDFIRFREGISNIPLE